MPKQEIKQDEKHALPGKVSRVRKAHSKVVGTEDAIVMGALFEPDGSDEVELIEQEGYGLWPVCGSCKKQIQPVLFNLHSLEHDPNAVLD